MSGNYLALKENAILSKFNLTFSYYASNETLFELEMIQRNLNAHNLQSYRFIDSDATVYLRNVKTGLYVGCKNTNTDGYLIFETKILAEKNENIAMHLSRANNSEVSECNFLMSCRPFVQKYLRYLSEFDKMRQKETQAGSKTRDLLYIVLKLNNFYQNIIDCLSILTKYAENKIMNENNRFNRDLISNRKKILNELDFIEMFCTILHLYYDNIDLQSISTNNALRKSNSIFERSLMAEDLEEQKKDANSEKKMLTRYYNKYVSNGSLILEAIYSFLSALVQKDDSNQKKLYEYLFCFQKHFAYFESSLRLALVMIEGNPTILSKLSDTFFESLNIVKDQLVIKDKKRFYEVDISFKDKAGYLYKEPYKEENKEYQDRDQIQVKQEIHVVANQKPGRPTSMIAYLLILLSRKIRRPLILEILASCCVCKGSNFVPNQEKLTELFTGNPELIKLFLSDLRMGKVKATRKLLDRYDEDEMYLVIRPCFEDKKVSNVFHKARIHFLTQQINLYSTLCAGRNLKWKNFLSQLFPEEDLKNEIIEPAYSNGNLYLPRIC